MNVKLDVVKGCDMREHPETRQYEPEPWELGWLACAFESEGYFTIVKSGSAIPYPRIGVANSDREYLIRVQRLVAGISGKMPKINVFHASKNSTQRRPMWRMEINHYGTVIAVINAILPYLCGKHSVAQLVRDFADACSQQNKLSKEERWPWYNWVRAFNNSARLFRKNLIALDNPQGTVKDSSETNEQPSYENVIVPVG